MKNIIKKSKSFLGLVLVFSLLVSLIIPSIASATAFPKTRASEVPKDGVYDNWAQDPGTKFGAEVNEVTDNGWLHLVSEPKNGNNPNITRQPAVFVNEDFVMGETGFFEFTYKSLDAPATNRFGIYINYDNPGNAFMLGSDSTGWFWQRYKAYGGSDYGSGSSSAPAVPAGEEVKIRIEWAGKKITSATVGGVQMLAALPFDFSNIGGEGVKIAIKAGSYANATISDVTDVYLKDIHYTGQETVTAYDVSGKVVDSDNNPISGVNVSAAGATTQFTDAAGNFSLDGLNDGTYSAVFSKVGFVSKTVGFEVKGADLVLANVSLASAGIDSTVLSTDEMNVDVDLNFPRAIQYFMKSSSKIMDGQVNVLDKIEINGISIKPTVTSTVVGLNKVEYEMSVKDVEKNIDAVLSAEIVVEKNNLAFNITKVVNNLNNDSFPVETIHIPNHNLVSVRSTDADANFKGANLSTDTTVSGDVGFAVTDLRPASTERHMYGFISNSQLSAGLWSNSEYMNGSSGERNNFRTSVYTEKNDGYTSVGLGSSYWYYHRKISAKNETEVVKQREMPSAKVAIADDENGDAKVDWQDGAIAFRTIMNNAVGSENVPELVAHRIAMNFGGQAQNPFLQSLDNVKKVALHTDGLGQSIILKGYGNEGHDSAHPDFYNIGKRIGGADDMVKLLKEGKQYGAKFGIHINTGEMYPEADAFSEDLVRRNADGTLRYGWNWIDQGVGIDGRYDLIMSERGKELGRKDRLQKLYDIVGNDLSFVYLDIWSNQTSGVEDTWDTRKVINDITSHGWTFVTEFGGASEYDATFHHWATDLGYGGFETKGHNSSVIRFLRNHQKDSWNADYTPHNGAAIAPLLGGYNMKDFEGWQGRNNYDDYIDNIFRHNIVTKFLQHYEATKWENGSPVTIGGKSWTPEMKITLEDSRRENKVVAQRVSNDYAGNLTAYRSRNITLNGKQILKGEMAEGTRNSTSALGRGSETYLIPWIWDSETGEFVDAADEKLYHWNILGGTTTWDLPDGWESLENVKLYKLTDLGKTEEQVLTVTNGKITIENAVASQPYVVYKGEAVNQLEIEWSVGMHIVDAGFNSGKLDNWVSVGTGSASIARSQFSNPMLKLTGEKSMTQTLTDLVPGQKYAVYVGVDNRSGSKAHITLKSDGVVLDSNYTTKSIAKNYIQANAHNTNSSTVGGTSYFQNMYVFFTAPVSGDVTLTLSREAGSGDTYFDDVRIAKTAADNITLGEDGSIVKFEQDFENNPQGIYPFVIGNVEGVQDNRTHLSELNAPFTQAGWDTKKMDDVLGGDWSVKTNGLVQKSKLLYQTVPQNFRFEAGKTYKVKFNYQMGSDGIYTFAVGNGEYNAAQMDQFSLKKSLGETATFEYLITGAESGQTWIGIYSTAVAADLQNAVGSGPQNFGGYKDIVLDNLVITEIDCDFTELSAAISEANKKYELDYSVASWAPFKLALSEAMALMTSEDLTQDKIDAAALKLTAETGKLVLVYTSIKGKVTDGTGTPVVGATISLTATSFTTKTLTTDANGEYSVSDINVRDFKLSVSYTSYYSSVHSFRPEAGKVFVKDVILVKLGVADYVNKFDGGDVSSLKNFPENAKQITVTPTTLNGSDAALIKFPSGRANLYDSASPMFTNGTFEAEITPQGNSARFGLQMRAINNTTRAFAGVGDSGGLYFWEYWNNGSNSYSGMSTGVVMQAGTTYKVKMETTANIVRLWVDGKMIINAYATGIHEIAGYVGFENRLASSFIIDNISVTSYDKSYVSGIVTNNKDEALENVSVELFDDVKRASVASATTDVSGKYNLGIVLAGSYSLKVSKEDYLTVTEDISIVGAGIVGAESVSLIYAPGLEALVEKASGLKKTNYSAEDWQALTQALLAADTITLASTDAEIKTITDNLAGVLEDIVHVKKVVLKELLDDAKELVKQDDVYMPDSIEALQEIIITAQAVYDNANATTTEIGMACLDLILGMDDLVLVPDKTDLKIYIDIAKEIDTTGYSDEMIADLEAAIEFAEEVYENPYATEDEIDSAVSALLEITSTFTANKELLYKTIVAALKLKDTSTPSSWTIFLPILEQALSINEDPYVSQGVVDSAVIALMLGMRKLVPIADKSALERTIKNAQAIVDNIENYIPSTIVGLESKLAEAKVLLANMDATKAQISSMVSQLSTLIAKARRKPNTTLLYSTVAAAEKIDFSLYTPASSSLFIGVLKEANNVLIDVESTQAVVDKMVGKIDVAKANLVLKTSGNGSGTTGTVDKTSGKTSVPKTGETGFVTVLTFVSGLALLASFVVRKRKETLKRK